MSGEMGLLRDINEALYAAFFVDEAAAARWQRIKDELDPRTRGALCFGLVNLDPAPPEILEELRRREGLS